MVKAKPETLGMKTRWMIGSIFLFLAACIFFLLILCFAHLPQFFIAPYPPILDKFVILIRLAVDMLAAYFLAIRGAELLRSTTEADHAAV